MHELPELPELPKLETFSPCVGQVFRLVSETDPPVEFELVEAKPLKAHPGAPRQDPFSLLFRGPAGVDVPQSMYTLRHERIGEVAVFLVPVDRRDDRLMLEAIFN
jgi:hypothetical protein